MWWEEYKKNKTIETRNKIIIENMQLVRAIAFKIKIKYYIDIDLDDLAAYGIFGLITAIERYNPKIGVKFSNYASSRIYGSILDELRKIDWIPRTVRNKIREAKKEIAYLEERNSSKEFTIAKKHGLSLMDFYVMSGSHIVSLALFENKL